MEGPGRGRDHSWNANHKPPTTRQDMAILTVTCQTSHPRLSWAYPAQKIEIDCVSVRKANSNAKTRPRKRSGTLICSSAAENTQIVPEPTVRTSVATENQAKLGAADNPHKPTANNPKPTVIAQRKCVDLSPNQRRISSGPNPVPNPLIA